MTPHAQRSADSEPAFELQPSGKTLFQERLSTYGLTLLVIASSYWVAFYFIWHDYPGFTDQRIFQHILAPGTFVLLALYTTLWLVCRARPLPSAWLPGLDLLFHFALGWIYRLLILSHPSAVLVPFESVFAVSTVLGIRALLLPSSGLRTALAGICLCIGPTFTLFADAEHFGAPWMGPRTSGLLFVNWAGVAIALTAIASRVLYGLRREVRDARRLGQYTLVERLGQGGMGVVYRAEHALLRRPTAVKLLPRSGHRDSIARFEREVQSMAELTHPNTVAIYDYGCTADGVFYYAMEHLDGIDLEDLVAVGGSQPPSRVIHLLRQICGSLDEAHRRGLIHRDVKPANLYLCEQRSEADAIKVLDFGLAKDVMTEDPELSVHGDVLGTPLYMSPEAFRAPAALDARSDLYSLGAVAYFLLTGTQLFSGGSAIEVCAQHLHERPDDPSTRVGTPLPADLVALVLACLEKDPSARPASARALRDALERCADAGRWSPDDAVDWWNEHRARIQARRKERAGSRASEGRTVIVDLERPGASRERVRAG